MSDTNKIRILKYLRKTRPAEFSAGDVAKALNFSTNQAGGYLKDIPGVKVKAPRKLARKESGSLYVFIDQECTL